MEGAKSESAPHDVRIVHPDEVADAFAERVSILAAQLRVTEVVEWRW
jgi:hypothetical protein